MANAAEIGALRIVLGLDAGKFRSGSREAEGVLEGFAREFKKKED